MPSATLTERERARIPKGNVRKLRDWFLTVATESSPQLQSARSSMHSAASPTASPTRLRSHTAVQVSPTAPAFAKVVDSAVMAASPTAASQVTFVERIEKDGNKATIVNKEVKAALELDGVASKHGAVNNVQRSQVSAAATRPTSENRVEPVSHAEKQPEATKCTSTDTLVGGNGASRAEVGVSSNVGTKSVKSLEDSVGGKSNVVVLQPIGPSEARDKARHRRNLLDGTIFAKRKAARFTVTDRRDLTPQYGWVRGTTPEKLAKIMTFHDNQQYEVLLRSPMITSDTAVSTVPKEQRCDQYGVWPMTEPEHYLERMRMFLSRSDKVVEVVQFYIDDPKVFDDKIRHAHYEKWIRVAEFLLALGNLHSFMAVVTALQLSPLFPRRHAIMTSYDNAALDRLLEIANPSNNFAQIRLRQLAKPVAPPASLDPKIAPGMPQLLNPWCNLTPFVLPWIREMEAAQSAQGLGLGGAADAVREVMDRVRSTLAVRYLYSGAGMAVYLDEYFYRQFHNLVLFESAWRQGPAVEQGGQQGGEDAAVGLIPS